MASIQWILGVTDLASGTFAKIGLSADKLKAQLDALDTRITTDLELKDAQYTAGIVKAAARADFLRKKLSEPIDPKGLAETAIELGAISAAMDRIDKRKKITVTVDVKTDGGSILAGLARRVSTRFSGRSGIAGSIGSLAGGAAGILGAAGRGLTTVTSGLPAVGNTLGALPPEAQAGLLLGAAVTALAALPAAAAAAGAGIITALGGAFGALGLIATRHVPSVEASFARLKIQAGNDLAAISTPFTRMWHNMIMTAQGQLPTLFLALHSAFTSIAGPLTKFADAFIRQLGGPAVTNAIRTLGTAFAMFLKAFTPQIPAIVGSLANGIRGIAEAFIAHPKMIQYMADMLGWLLRLPGYALAALGALIRFGAWFFGPLVQVVVDADNAVKAIIKWFNSLPPGVKRALAGLGGILLTIAKTALGMFLGGLKSAATGIFGWLHSFFGTIISIGKTVLGIFSPSKVFFEMGRNLMEGFIGGIKSRATAARNTIRGAVGGPAGGAPSAAAAYARSLAARYGWSSQWNAINYVAMAESGWNMRARNPSSGAYGIAQFINGPSEYYQYGGNPNTIAGQVTAFFNYIRSRYGSPSAAAAHEAAYHWYDRGGWLPPGVSLAVNQTGQPERVTSAAGEQALIARLDRLIALNEQIPARVAAGVSGAVNGSSRQAAHTARYSARPR